MLVKIMSKKGKRLREFEKKNRAFNVRESKPKERTDIRREEEMGEVLDINRRIKNSSETKDNKKKKKTVINTRKLVASIVIVVFIFSIGMSAIKLIKLKNEKDELAERQAELKELKEELTTELEHIDSAEYIEQQARKTLRLVKKNEILFILSEGDKYKAENTQEEDTDDGQAEN